MESIQKLKTTAANGSMATATKNLGKAEAELKVATKEAAAAETPDAKRKADEEAAWQGAQMRKAKHALSVAKITMQRATEEATKMSEEAAGAEEVQNLKN